MRRYITVARILLIFSVFNHALGAAPGEIHVRVDGVNVAEDKETAGPDPSASTATLSDSHQQDNVAHSPSGHLSGLDSSPQGSNRLAGATDLPSGTLSRLDSSSSQGSDRLTGAVDEPSRDTTTNHPGSATYEGKGPMDVGGPSDNSPGSGVTPPTSNRFESAAYKGKGPMDLGGPSNTKGEGPIDVGSQSYRPTDVGGSSTHSPGWEPSSSRNPSASYVQSWLDNPSHSHPPLNSPGLESGDLQSHPLLTHSAPPSEYDSTDSHFAQTDHPVSPAHPLLTHSAPPSEYYSTDSHFAQTDPVSPAQHPPAPPAEPHSVPPNHLALLAQYPPSPPASPVRPHYHLERPAPPTPPPFFNKERLNRWKAFTILGVVLGTVVYVSTRPNNKKDAPGA